MSETARSMYVCRYFVLKRKAKIQGFGWHNKPEFWWTPCEGSPPGPPGSTATSPYPCVPRLNRFDSIIQYQPIKYRSMSKQSRDAYCIHGIITNTANKVEFCQQKKAFNWHMKIHTYLPFDFRNFLVKFLLWNRLKSSRSSRRSNLFTPRMPRT